MKALAQYFGLNRAGRVAAVALLSGAAILVCALEFPLLQAAAGAVFLLGLLGGACVDLDEMVIPDLFTVGLALAGVVFSAAVPALHHLGPPSAFNGVRSAAAALLGLGLGSAFGLWIGILGELALGREVLGFGDVKLLGAIGAFCGWRGAVFSLFGGAIIGAAVLVAAELHRRLTGRQNVLLIRVESASGETGRVGWGAAFPFGPMLAAAAALYLVALHPWVDGYLSRYLILF